MTKLARFARGGALALAIASPAAAQTYHDTGGTIPQSVVPLIGCSPSGNCAGPVSGTNPLPVSGTFSASLSGFQPTPAYSTLAVGASSSRVALPAGTVVVVYNTGANAAYVQLGNSGVTATTSNDVVQPNSWLAFTVGSATYLAAIETAGTTALNISGGAGLPTGAGGGGSGGSVPTGSAGTPNASVVTVQGIAGETAVKVDGSGVTQPVSGTFWQATQPVSLASLPALASGANTIGAVTQASSPWTINQTQINGSAVSTAASGVQKVGAVGSTGTALDSAAGTPNGQAVTIQGNASGVAVPVSGTFWQATQPVSLASLPALATGSNTIGAVSQNGSWTVTATQATGSNLHVVCDSGCSSSTAPADESAFTAGTTSQSPAGGFYQTTATANALTNGQMGAWQMTANRAGFVNLRSASGTEIGTASTPVQVSLANTAANATAVKVDGSGVTQPVSGTFWQATQPVSLASLPALATGSNTIGAVTQASGPWTMNITQVAGSAAGITTWGTAPTGASVLNANVNCLSGCGGSGGTSLGDNGSFTAGTTAFTPVGGVVGASALTSGHAGAAAMDTGRNLFMNLSEVGGAAVALGQTTMSASVPVAIASNQSNLPANIAQIGGSNVTTAASGVQKVGVVGNAGTAFDAALAAGTAPTNGVALVGVYNSTLPSPTTGQSVGVQLDAKGQIRDDVNYWAGSALGAPSNYGTSPGAVAVPGVNAFVTNTVPVSGTFWQATQPVSATSLPLPTGAATAANQPSAAAQGSTTSGQTGPLAQGAVTSSAPTYSNAQTDPLSLDTAGNLRVSMQACASGVCPANVTPGDAIATGTYGSASPQIGVPLVWNGASYDRAKEGATSGSVLVGPQTLTGAVKAGLTNSAVSVKASAGTLAAVNCDNANTGSVIVEFFNTSSVSLGTTAPAWFVSIPAGGGGSNLPQGGVSLGGSAIYAAAVTAYNGSTAPSSTLNCSVGYL